MDLAEIVKQSDELHENLKLIEDYDLLKPHVETGGLEIQYRFARACRTRILNDAKNDKHKIKELTEEGLKAAELAVASNDKSPTAHMWLGIFYDLEGQLSGINKRIENAYKVRDEFEASFDIMCHEVASLGKLERAFASTFFKKPPESSYEEAVKFLLKSTECKS
ncbi:cellular calcium ion homeostasis [Sparganum proliferum]